MPQPPNAPHGRSRLQQEFNRRAFLKTLAAGSAGVMVAPHLRVAAASLPKAKITKVNIYRPANFNETFNQSNMVVTVETDQPGLIGVGDGGLRDTLEQCAGKLIGRNPFDIERCWQDMYRSWFYSPGHEKIHALGALDTALWDIKGKALGVPIYDLMGGMNRDYVECYLGGGGTGTQLRENARAAMEQGYRAFRVQAPGTAGGGGARPRSWSGPRGAGRARPVRPWCRPFPSSGRSRQAASSSISTTASSDSTRWARISAKVSGPSATGRSTFTRSTILRTPSAAATSSNNTSRTSSRIRRAKKCSANDIPKLRKLTTVPLTAGEQWGQRWDFNDLVENHDIDYVRCTLPNVGGITEMMKIAAMCETHAVGIIPHFTGPIAVAAIVHALGPFSGPVLVEIGNNTQMATHISEGRDLRTGKLFPTGRPGLGVTLNMAQLTLVSTISARGGGPTTYYRPDGSQTNW